MRWVIGLFVTLFAFSAVHAATYQWVDSRGVVHFTDDPDKVPAKYRKKVKVLESVQPGKGAAAPSREAPPAAAPLPPEKQAETYGGHDERWWRVKYASLRKERDDIQANLPGKREALTQLHRKWVISMGRTPKPGETRDDRFIKPPPDESGTFSHALGNPGKHREAYYAMKAEIERDEARIGEIEEELAALDAEATRAGVPFEWRK